MNPILSKSEMLALGLGSDTSFQQRDQHGEVGPAEGRAATTLVEAAIAVSQLLGPPVPSRSEGAKQGQVVAAQAPVADHAVKIPSLKGLAEVRVLKQNPGVYLVDLGGKNAYTTGALGEHPDGYWVVDALEGAKMRICTDERDCLLDFADGQLNVYECEQPVSEFVQSLNSDVAAPAVSLPTPQIALPQSAPSWLSELVDDYVAESDPFYRSAGVGAVFRHAGAAVVSDVEGRPLDELLAVAPADGAVRKQATTWVRGLDEAQLSLVEEYARAVASSLLDELGELTDLFEGDPVRDAGLVRTLLHRRDDLEGVCELLAVRDRGKVVRDVLDLVDDMGRDQLTMLASVVGLGDDERLRATSWEDPGAWWASLAAG